MVIDGCKDKYQERARQGAEMTTEKLCRRWAGGGVGRGVPLSRGSWSACDPSLSGEEKALLPSDDLEI